MSVPNLPPQITTDHQHVFKSCIRGDATKDQEKQVLQTVDEQDLETMPLDDITTLSLYICQSCYAWLYASHSLTEASFCTGTDYVCHHYHVQGLDTYGCCGCAYTLATEIRDPVLPITILNRLSATRAQARTFADQMQDKEHTPTMASTLTTVLVYIEDLLSGASRNSNTHNPHFLARIGLIKRYWKRLDLEEERLKQIQQEILLVMDAFRSELGATSIPVNKADTEIKLETADMATLLGIISTLENRYKSSDGYLVGAYEKLGLTSGASDTLVKWTYHKMMEEYAVDPYDTLDALMVIAQATKSDLLQTLIACERSQGKIARSDIGDAYAYFGLTDDVADDRLLIGLYQFKLSDEPLEKNLHQDNLSMITISSLSTEI
ncbi:uncharacterized protein EV154DRAFT_606314 [Mucor mucedo]|uniref:uncharacterized protein n=1 Tax=Mucor mucedo TaxID=29922 RepID=UPI00221FA378|nr:uncharacterized protein EV154DRAFT_606314 [Mucor mucedo]KAI7880293.1 hypothetical protein EV154DRAFT_606314 [Mucor mucedo]